MNLYVGNLTLTKKNMNCPTCKKIRLEQTERLGFYFSFCPCCNGMWFERAELNKVLDRLYSEDSTHQKEHSVKNENESNEKHDSAIIKQIYENRELHYHHAHPRSRHWLHHLFR